MKRNYQLEAAIKAVRVCALCEGFVWPDGKKPKDHGALCPRSGK